MSEPDHGASEAHRTGTERIARVRHTLVSEGAPHDAQGKRLGTNARWVGVAGKGRALCTCGTLSDEMPSAYQRRKWHREVHKPEHGIDVRRPLDGIETSTIEAIRNPVRGQAHRSTALTGVLGDVPIQTGCGKSAAFMTETILLSRVDPSDRCRVCW